MCKLKNMNIMLCLFLSFTWRNAMSKLKKQHHVAMAVSLPYMEKCVE